MKIFKISFLMLMFVFFGLSRLNAQSDLQVMIETGVDIADELTKYNIELLRTEFDILNANETKSSYRIFYAGQIYGVSGFGERIQDLDIIVYRSIENNWVEVARDKTSASDASVSIVPEITELYRIDIIAYTLKPNFLYGYYGLFIASNTGTDSKLMSQFMRSALLDVKAIESQLDYKIIRAEFDILNKSSLTTKSMWRNLLGGLNYYAVACGGSRIRDIDLYAYKKTDDDWVLQGKDNIAKSTALVKITPPFDGFYRFDVQAYSFEDGYDADVYGLFLLLK